MINAFNLSMFVKEAMGYKNVRYRPPSGGEYMWFDLEEIKANENPAWSRWLRINPSLKTVETECISFDKDMLDTFCRRYGLPPVEVRKFFKVWIGYNPNWGAYLCSIGPYRYSGGAKDESTSAQLTNIDRANRFSFFTKRFQFADEETVNGAYSSYVSEKLSMYSDILGRGDFDFDIKMADGFKEDGSIQWATTSLSLDDPQMQILHETRAFMGADSQININEKGLSKIIKSIAEKENCQDILAQAIQSVATKRNMPADIINALVQTGEWNPSGVTGRSNLNPKAVLEDVFDSMQKFFPLMIRRQARNGGWEDILTEAVGMAATGTMADSQGNQVPISVDRIWQILSENISGDENAPRLQERQYANKLQAQAAATVRNNLVKKIVENINTIKKRIIKENKVYVKGPKKDTPESAAAKQAVVARMESIRPLPILQDLGKKRSGAQKPIALGVRTSHKSLLMLKAEILRYLSQQDPNQPINFEEIARLMTESRAGSRALAQGGTWTPNDVALWVERISEELSEQTPEGRQRTFSDLLSQTDREIEELSNEQIRGSFSDFDTACRMASIYFMEADYEAIDPGTRAVKTVDYRRPPPLFQRDEGAPNISSDQLTVLRTTQSQEEATPAAAGKAVATEQDIASQIGEAPSTTPTEKEVPVAEEQPPATPVPAGEDLTDEQLAQMEQRPVRKFLKNTLKTLIKIAEELDNEGKTDASEEIHKIIRKYLG